MVQSVHIHIIYVESIVKRMNRSPPSLTGLFGFSLVLLFTLVEVVVILSVDVRLLISP